MESVNPFTDRLVIEPKPQTTWRVPHAFWFTTMGIGGGLFLNEVIFGIEMGHVLGLSLSHLLSLILIGIGGLVLIADLGKPFRFLQAFRNVRSSWITWGAICDFVFLFLDGLYILPTFTWVNGAKPLAGLPTGPGTPLGVTFAAVAGIAAFVVIIYPGMVLAASRAIPFWNTTLIPVQFLAFAHGSALGLVLLAKPKTVDGVLSLSVILLTLLSLLSIGAHLLNAHYGREASRESLRVLLRGSLKGVFLLGTCLLGLIIPLALGLVALNVAGSNLAVAAFIPMGTLLLVGNFCSKLSVIRAGRFAPLI
ncbi:MAG: NrfD/PsrC family molybdoenzyme membrane anchor subunit [Nitrospinota bacterium]